MRRSQCEITDKKSLEEILRRCRIGRLATIGADGYPYITPLNYVYWQEAIYFHCAHKGEKMDNLRRDDPGLFRGRYPAGLQGHAISIPQGPACQVHQFYHSVIIRGRAEVVDSLEEKVGALNALMAAHERIAGFSPDHGGYAGSGGLRRRRGADRVDVRQERSGPEKE